MGYETWFSGEWEISPPLAANHLAYLKQFTQIRHMKRDADLAELLDDPLRDAVGLPIGYEGAYFVGTANRIDSQTHDETVLDGNEPPGMPSMTASNDPSEPMADWSERWKAYSQAQTEARIKGAVPGLWCPWEPDESGTTLGQDEGGKHYDFTEWIHYLVINFFEPWGYTLNGEIYWSGEEDDDRGAIRITNNVIKIGNAVITYAFN